jgi:hypothetical protein
MAPFGKYLAQIELIFLEDFFFSAEVRRRSANCSSVAEESSRGRKIVGRMPANLTATVTMTELLGSQSIVTAITTIVVFPHSATDGAAMLQIFSAPAVENAFIIVRLSTLEVNKSLRIHFE